MPSRKPTVSTAVAATTVATPSPIAEKVEKAPKAEKAEKAEKVEKKIPKKDEVIIPTAAAAAIPTEDETDAEVATEDENSVEFMFKRCLQMGKALSEDITAYQQYVKKLHKAYTQEQKRTAKMSQKSAGGKKKRSGTNGLDKLIPIQTPDFQGFVEKNYQNLKDKDGNQIITELAYDGENALLISRKSALKIITAYVKANNMQKYDDKKRIAMDATLKKLFPDHAEKKDKSGKVIKEEEFFFYSIMGALSKHLKKDDATEATA